MSDHYNLGLLIHNLRRAARGDPEIDARYCCNHAADLLEGWHVAMQVLAIEPTRAEAEWAIDAVGAPSGPSEWDRIEDADTLHREAFEATDVWHKAHARRTLVGPPYGPHDPIVWQDTGPPCEPEPTDSARSNACALAGRESVFLNLPDAPPSWCDRLVMDPNVSDDSPVVKGSWVTARHVVSLVVDGWPWESIQRAHPEITDEDIRACLSYSIEENQSI